MKHLKDLYRFSSKYSFTYRRILYIYQKKRKFIGHKRRNCVCSFLLFNMERKPQARIVTNLSDSRLERHCHPDVWKRSITFIPLSLTFLNAILFQEMCFQSHISPIGCIIHLLRVMCSQSELCMYSCQSKIMHSCQSKINYSVLQTHSVLMFSSGLFTKQFWLRKHQCIYCWSFVDKDFVQYC